METVVEEPDGPCPCEGAVCNKGYGWVFSSIRDLAGNFHSGRQDVTVCLQFPEDLMEWDVEDGMWLPPLPPGMMSKETLKGFMPQFKGTDKDLQHVDSDMRDSELASEGRQVHEGGGAKKLDKWQEEYS